MTANTKFAALALAVDQPSRMPLVHPVTNQPLRTAGEEPCDAYIDLLSTDSEKANIFERQITNRRLSRRNRATNLTAEELEAENIDRLANLTHGWLLVGLDGKVIDVPFTEANARELYAGLPWVRDQVQAWINNLANFTKTSSTTSADQQSSGSASI